MKNEILNSSFHEKDTNWEQELRHALHQTSSLPNDAHLHATISLVEKEVCLRQQRRRITFSRFLAKQIGFTWRNLWIVQGISLIILRILFSRFYSDSITPLYLIKLLACLSILIFMSALPLLYRSARYQMQEVEAASRFSGVKLLLARLIVIGIGDACLLTSLFLTTILKTILPADSAAFCLCFPFLLAGGGCLYLLGHFPPKQFFAGSLLLCSFLAVAFGITPWQDTFLYQPSLTAVRVILCALPFAFCVQQLRYLMKGSSYEEMQLG